ncbi:MAG: recombinase family protein [Bacillota bacterium]|nr:recombinase family protein [Bacillota bacterium]
MESNIINVYGYIRVSTEGQAKQGYSLVEQRVEIEKYCSSKSYKLLKIFKDEGISGAKANEDEMSVERDGLIDMLALVDMEYAKKELKRVSGV